MTKNFSLRIFIIILFLSLPIAASAGELYVVVSNNLKGRAFSAEEVKHILLGDISLINDARINLIYPSYSSPEIETLSSFVGKGGSVRNLKSYWSRMIFTGKGIPPKTANDDQELKQMLEKDNSIGVTTVATGMNVVYTIN